MNRSFALYSFDTSAFVDSWRRYYPPDIFQPIWDRIKEIIDEQRILASWMVREELSRQDDDLWTFVKDLSALFVEPGDGEEVTIRRLLSNPDFNAWGTSPRHQADPFVVSLALARNLVVVTYENPHSTKNAIPAACRFLNIPCITFIVFLRRDNIRFLNMGTP